MKRFTKTILACTLLLAVLICSVSCGEPEDMIKYSESGLNFALPRYMSKLEVEYADVCFGNLDAADGTEFFVYFYSSDSLLTDLYLSKDSTVKEYADWFSNVNGYENVEEDYDEAGKKITLKYIYEPESTYYIDYILRNEYALFHVTMCCKVENMDTYEPLFEEWMKHISIDY